LSKKVVIGILLAAGLVFLLTRSKPQVQTTPAAISSPSDSDSPATEPSDSPKTGSSPSTFAGDSCTSDCSGHEAGYNWAEEHGIDDESDCDTAGETSNSPSFAEGCRAYVRENEPDQQTDDDSDN
jgi:hypothetical protein